MNFKEKFSLFLYANIAVTPVVLMALFFDPKDAKLYFMTTIIAELIIIGVIAFVCNDN